MIREVLISSRDGGKAIKKRASIFGVGSGVGLRCSNEMKPFYVDNEVDLIKTESTSY